MRVRLRQRVRVRVRVAMVGFRAAGLGSGLERQAPVPERVWVAAMRPSSSAAQSAPYAKRMAT